MFAVLPRSFRPAAWWFLSGIICVGLLGVAHADADPSLTPVRSVLYEDQFGERFRFRLDFNADGVKDLAISQEISIMGRLGAMFEIYLASADETDFTFFETMLLHPKAISAEMDPHKPGGVRIWTYMRSSGSSGGLGYYQIWGDEFKDFQGIEINPGDGGTSTGRAMYAAVFARSDVQFDLERSSTSKDGVVNWAKVDW